MQYMTEPTSPFDTFYTRFLPLVQQVLGGILRGECRDFLEDLTQETFVKAWKAFDQLDHLKSPRAWISAIAKNAACDFLRQRHARQRLDCPLLEEAAEFLPDSHPGAQAVYSGEAESITQALAQMRPDDQQVMTLLFQEYTQAEIATVLHLDSEACRVRIRRARRRFQKHYVQA